MSIYLSDVRMYYYKLFWSSPKLESHHEIALNLNYFFSHGGSLKIKILILSGSSISPIISYYNISSSYFRVVKRFLYCNNNIIWLVLSKLVLERTPKYQTSNTPNIELSEHHILAQNRTSNKSNITKNWTVCEHQIVSSKTSLVK